VFLKLDADKETHLKKKFSVKAIPDYMIIDKDNNIIKRNKGYLNKDSFMKWLED
jgi:thioredoxin-related protein